MTVFVCKAGDVQEAPPPENSLRPSHIRDEVLSLWGIVQFAQNIHRTYKLKRLRECDVMLHYAINICHSTRPRTPMDVPIMIANWKAVVVTLCTAHDKAAIDAAEYKMDELLTPILGAPVAQLREFYAGLTTALREDERVPFFVWSMFNAWGKTVIDKSEDKEERKGLKRKLATEIANLVEEDIQPDIATAVAGALMWRSPETLQEIKEDLKAGAKPRLRGRESCLFLVTKRPGLGHAEHQVML